VGQWAAKSSTFFLLGGRDCFPGSFRPRISHSNWHEYSRVLPYRLEGPRWAILILRDFRNHAMIPVVIGTLDRAGSSAETCFNLDEMRIGDGQSIGAFVSCSQEIEIEYVPDNHHQPQQRVNW
jgi:hypothetical protein